MIVTVTQKRNCDVRDVIRRSRIVSMPNAEFVLKRQLQVSEEVWFGMCDDEVACVWGIAPSSVISDRAFLWLITTDLVEEHKFIFIRRSQMVIKDILKKYEVLTGYVEDGNYAAKKWLRYLGAKMNPPINGFSLFTIRRE